MNVRGIMCIPVKLQNSPLIGRPLCMAAYCRVSSPSDRQELNSETQVAYYISKIESPALWKNAGAFVGTATGRNAKQRVEFKRLLAKCCAGKVDLIDVYFDKENIHLLNPTA